ncbi:MAG: hypothetical protein C4K60_07675 [Ideonella sp. MAG2]|nr:MAG: hypothetical protein C4K60_07675 [Ideonella sp. MAG2]
MLASPARLAPVLRSRVGARQAAQPTDLGFFRCRLSAGRWRDGLGPKPLVPRRGACPRTPSARCARLPDCSASSLGCGTTTNTSLGRLGFEQQQLAEASGLIFVVTEAQIRYLRSARLDDLLAISVCVQELTPTTMRIFQQAHLGETVLCEATVRIACVQRERMRPSRIPAPLLQAIRP